MQTSIYIRHCQGHYRKDGYGFFSCPSCSEGSPGFKIDLGILYHSSGKQQKGVSWASSNLRAPAPSGCTVLYCCDSKNGKIVEYYFMPNTKDLSFLLLISLYLFLSLSLSLFLSLSLSLYLSLVTPISTQYVYIYIYYTYIIWIHLSFSYLFVHFFICIHTNKKYWKLMWIIMELQAKAVEHNLPPTSRFQ